MSFDACADLVRKGDPDRFRCAMVAKPHLRGRLLALYAFNLEVARAPWVTQEPLIAQMRLQFWQDAIVAIYQGETPRKHEIVLPLAQVIGEHNLPRHLFEAMISARNFDIGREPHASREAFDHYIENTSGALYELAARAFSTPETALAPVRNFGYAAGVAKLLLALPRLYAAGRDPIPTGWVPERSLIAQNIAPEPLARAVHGIADDALARLHSARAKRKLVPKAALLALLPGRDAATILGNVLKAPDKVLQLAPPSEFQQRWSLLWRVSTGLW